MSWLFSVDPSVIIGLVSALGCLYFLCICAEETKALLAYRRAARCKVPPVARQRTPDTTFGWHTRQPVF